MSKDKFDDRVTRIQADRLCVALGMKKGTYIPREMIERMKDAKIGEKLTIAGTEVIVSPSLRGVAILVSQKIKASEVKVDKQRRA